MRDNQIAQIECAWCKTIRCFRDSNHQTQFPGKRESLIEIAENITSVNRTVNIQSV